ncbi:MAG TPA: hypothetical protein VL693_12325 [Vicinamibacterales bacterium]|jgi:hypothetical protein|nr:hypothetical protein [Vicinamibacterales bacterium]
MRAVTILGAAFALALAGAACERGSQSATEQSGGSEKIRPAGSESASASSAAPKRLTLTYDRTQNPKPIVGTSIEATAEGLPPNKKLDFVWGTVEGGWVIEDYFHFKGKKYTETMRTLSQVTTDANGLLKTRFAVPEDFGGVHEIFVRDGNTTLAQGGIEVGQSFEMSPKQGPVGTPIELRVKGLGWRTMESTWVVNWDNQQAGYVSAAGSHGSATARFRASGVVGDHTINVMTGYMGQAYLNHEQAPNAYLPVPQFAFRVMPGRAATPSFYAEPYQPQPVPASTGVNGAMAKITPTQGAVATKASLNVTGLPANTPVSLVWGSYEGNRVSGNGFEPIENELTKVTTTADGRIAMPISIPEDLGGRHAIEVRSGDKTLATTYFVIETSIVSMTPTSGPAGTPVTIHLKGVGWTEYDNIYVATYDNAYMGYACGFNTGGDVVIHFTAAGAAGVHLIDLYPGIYQGPQDQAQQLYRLPQLTYAEDHPGNKIPALRFAFEVTPGPARAIPPLSGATR